MTCIKVSKGIEKYRIRLDTDDELYYSCIWADIYLDSDNWTLMAVSDCGDYSHCWGYEKGRTFKQFLSKLNRTYLLSKIAKEDQFDFYETMKNLLCQLFEARKSGSVDKQTARAIYNYITEIDNCDDVTLFNEISSHWETSDFYDNAWESFIYRYANCAITFADIFIKMFQPILRKEELDNVK